MREQPVELGVLLDGIDGDGVAFEREADYVGAYCTVRAGYGLIPERRFIRTDVDGTKAAPAP